MASRQLYALPFMRSGFFTSKRAGPRCSLAVAPPLLPWGLAAGPRRRHLQSPQTAADRKMAQAVPIKK